MRDKITTIEIEHRVASYFGYRQNLIVPNISWGMNIHECDLLIITKGGYGIEVEIKVSRSDLKNDSNKSHSHDDDRIKKLYFAIPDYMKDSIDLIPKRAGILVLRRYYEWGDNIGVHVLREPEINKHCIKFSSEEMFNIARLGTMRIWNLKKKIITTKRKPIQKKIPSYKNQLELSI